MCGGTAGSAAVAPARARLPALARAGLAPAPAPHVQVWTQDLLHCLVVHPTYLNDYCVRITRYLTFYMQIYEIKRLSVVLLQLTCYFSFDYQNS